MFSKRLLLSFVLALSLLMTAELGAQDQEPINLRKGFVEKWEAFDFSKTVLQEGQIKNFDLQELLFVRGIIFARHGRKFKSKYLQFNIEDLLAWYKPNPNYSNAMLNEIERKNLDLVRSEEAKQRNHVELGDMHFYRERFVNEKLLADFSGTELKILAAEIEATHGKKFDDEPWLQQYFDERYWYQSNENYDPKRLNETERKNLEFINASRKQRYGLKVAPGDMAFYQDQLLTEDMLQGVGLYDLRLLRNEIYARRGRRFRTPWIQRYFDQEDWYERLPDFREPKLSAIEVKNIDMIVKVERRIHESLSSELIAPEVLEGMYLEDARKLRNEIYARHGRVFKDKWLQGYFASFAWHKPNPVYKDDVLNEIEAQNIAAILAHEKEALSEMNAFEG